MNRQGFEVYNNYIYESTGLYGRSTIRKIEIDTGIILKSVKLDDKYFGEGLTIFNDKLYVVTWKERTGWIFDPESLEIIKEFNFTSTRNEGWGLTHNDKYIIMSDGSNYLHFYDDEFNFINKIDVTYEGKDISNINELEMINDYVWGNIWYKNYIVIIDPNTGLVVHKADMTNIVSKSNRRDVLNGILYHNNHVYITGKLWGDIYILSFSNLPKLKSM